MFEVIVVQPTPQEGLEAPEGGQVVGPGMSEVPLTDRVGLVAAGRQDVGQCCVFGVHAILTAHLQHLVDARPVRIHARQKGDPCVRAGRKDVVVGQASPRRYQSIDGRRPDTRPLEAKVGVPHVVDDDHDNVRALGRCDVLRPGRVAGFRSWLARSIQWLQGGTQSGCLRRRRCFFCPLVDCGSTPRRENSTWVRNQPSNGRPTIVRLPSFVVHDWKPLDLRSGANARDYRTHECQHQCHGDRRCAGPALGGAGHHGSVAMLPMGTVRKKSWQAADRQAFVFQTGVIRRFNA